VTAIAQSAASPDAWTWWQSRRLRYNLALGAAGWVAYGATLGLFTGFGHPLSVSWQGVASMTLFLSVAYLVFMGVANVCYLIGPATEVWVRPKDLGLYRKGAFAMGFWSSVALPFAIPALGFSLLIGNGT
jgi:hypothetical protein